MLNLLTYLGLIALTAAAALVSGASGEATRPPILLMLLAAAKFLLVVFLFMDLRRAHFAWKFGMLGFTGLFLTLFLFAG